MWSGWAKPSRKVTPAPQVATLCRKAIVTQPLRHQLCPEVRDPRRVHSALDGRVGKPVARQRRDHDIEGVRGVSSVAGRVGKQRYYLQDLVERAGPAMSDDDRHWVGALTGLVDKMDAQPVYAGPKVPERVHSLLLGPPIETRSPVFDHLLHVGEVRSILPPRVGDLVRPTGAAQALP